MASSKVTDYTEITSPANDDVLYMVDVSSSGDRKIQWSNAVPSSYVGSTMTTGSLLLGAAGVASSLAIGASGYVLESTGGTAAWRSHFINSIYHPDRPPTVAGAGDDEFASTVINVAWTATGISSGTIGSTWVSTGSNLFDLDYMTGSLSVSLAGATNAAPVVNMWKTWAPAATNAWSISMKAHVPTHASSLTFGCGFLLADSSNLSSGLGMRAVFRGFSLADAIFYGLASAATAYVLGSSAQHFFDPIYLGAISPAASSVAYFYYSQDGIGWKIVGNTTTSHAITHLGIAFDKTIALNEPIMPIVIDWIRTSTGTSLKMGA